MSNPGTVGDAAAATGAFGGATTVVAAESPVTPMTGLLLDGTTGPTISIDEADTGVAVEIALAVAAPAATPPSVTTVALTVATAGVPVAAVGVGPVAAAVVRTVVCCAVCEDIGREGSDSDEEAAAIAAAGTVAKVLVTEAVIADRSNFRLTGRGDRRISSIPLSYSRSQRCLAASSPPPAASSSFGTKSANFCPATATRESPGVGRPSGRCVE